MRCFEDVADTYQEPTKFRFLYVGVSPADRASTFLESIRAFEGFAAETHSLNQATFEDVEPVIRRLQPRDFGECLIVAFDLGPKAGSSEVERFLAHLPSPPRRSQVVAFLVADVEPRLSFRDFVHAIGFDVAWVGDAKQCLASMRRWCTQSGPLQPTLDLRLPCQLLPSWWIRCIGHDYIVKIKRQNWRKELEQAGLWESQREIDLWQRALRSVLAFPFSDKTAYLSTDDPAFGAELQVRIDRTPLWLVVPTSVKEGLTALDWSSQGDVSIHEYSDRATAEHLLAKGRQADAACILLHDPAIDEPTNRSGGQVAPYVPAVLVSDTSHQLPWKTWTDLLGQNTLGSFRTAELVGTLDKRLAILPVKMAHWKSFCFLPLRQAVDHIISAMLETYAHLESLPENTVTSDGRRRVFQALAQVACARGLYFASQEEEPSLMNRSAGKGKSSLFSGK